MAQLYTPAQTNFNSNINLGTKYNPNRLLLTIYKLLSALTKYMVERQRANRLRAELQALSDRQLADIGICYADIERIVRGENVKRDC